MSDLRECPCCFGILDVPKGYKLTSACRCGFPEVVTWTNFPREAPELDQLTEVHPDPFRRSEAA